jgi:hypothetical protein
MPLGGLICANAPSLFSTHSVGIQAPTEFPAFSDQTKIWCDIQLHKEKAAKLLILLVDMWRQVVIIRMTLKDCLQIKLSLAPKAEDQ